MADTPKVKVIGVSFMFTYPDLNDAPAWLGRPLDFFLYKAAACRL